jgi:hypothetical protein
MATQKKQPAAPVAPKLTEAQKLIAMTFQRDMLQLAANIEASYLNTVASELKIDTNKWVFALDTLTLMEKK